MIVNMVVKVGSRTFVTPEAPVSVEVEVEGAEGEQAAALVEGIGAFGRRIADEILETRDATRARRVQAVVEAQAEQMERLHTHVPEGLVSEREALDSDGDECSVETVPVRLLILVNDRAGFDAAADAPGADFNTVCGTIGALVTLARKAKKIDMLGVAAERPEVEVLSRYEREQFAQRTLEAESEAARLRTLLSDIAANEGAMRVLDTAYGRLGGASIGAKLREKVGSNLPTFPLADNPIARSIEALYGRWTPAILLDHASDVLRGVEDSVERREAVKLLLDHVARTMLAPEPVPA